MTSAHNDPAAIAKGLTTAFSREIKSADDLLSSPVDVIGLSWDDGWEFDRPIVILRPFRRYGFDRWDSLVEDWAIDATDRDTRGKPFSHENCDKEFDWRGWDWNWLEAIWVRRAVRKLKTPHGYFPYLARLQFYRKENEFNFDWLVEDLFED